MQSQKRIKTLGHQIKDLSQKKYRKQKHDKSINYIRPHKQSQYHIKSISKDITPTKHSIVVQRSKYKDNCISNKKMAKNKQLTSVCSYSAIQKESLPATKRKFSNARSIKKKVPKYSQKINQSLKSTVSNFSILTKCLTQYIKQQKKKGKDPSKQILHLIKAFTRSEVAPVSKDLQLLISNMLDYIQNSIGYGKIQQSIKSEVNDQRIKSRSSFSQASDHEIVYSQILQNSFIPPTVKKPFNKVDKKQTTFQNDTQIKQSKKDQNLRSIQSDQYQQDSKKYTKKQNKKIQKQLQIQLKNDLKNMHDQLYYLKSAGQKLHSRAQVNNQDRKKLQQIYHQNKKVLENLQIKKTQNIKYAFNQNQEEDEQYNPSEQDEDN